MLQKISAFGLALVAGSAIAGPIGNVLGGVSGVLGNVTGAAPTASVSGARLPALPMVDLGTLGAGNRKAVAGSDAALPGLAAEGPLGVTLLQEGADGSGYNYVLNSDQLQPLADALQPLTNDVVSSSVANQLTQALFQRDLVSGGTLLDSDHFIDDGLDNNLVTPLLGFDGDGGMIDVALFDGNGTANAGSDGLLGAAVGSGSFTGNGGAIAVGALNEGFSGNGGQIGVGVLNQGPVSGNGGQIGIGVLSGEGSGNGGSLGIGVLNTNDVLHICGGGFCGSANDVIGQASAIPHSEFSGIAIGGGPDGDPVTSSNPLLNLGLLTGDGAGSGGLIGLGVIAGDNAAQADLLGVCVLCGNNAGSGSLSVAALSGINSGNSDGNGTIPLGVGVGALNKGFSGNGSDLGVGALNGVASGNGGLIGVGALNEALSGNGGELGVGALNGGGSGNGGSIGVGAINGGGSTSGGAGGNNGNPGGNSGGGGVIGVGAINTGTPGTTNNPGNNGGTPGNGGNQNNVGDAGDDGMCALEVRDGKGRVTQTVKRPCKQLSKPKRAVVAKA